MVRMASSQSDFFGMEFFFCINSQFAIYTHNIEMVRKHQIIFFRIFGRVLAVRKNHQFLYRKEKVCKMHKK